MSFSQAKTLSDLDRKISSLSHTDETYKGLLDEFFSVVLVQFQEFRDQMMTTKRVNQWNTDYCTTQKREITIIWSEIRTLINWEITASTFTKIKKLFFEAHWIATYYISSTPN